MVWPETSAYNATYGLARVLSERGHHIWKQVVMVSTDSDESRMRARTDVLVVFCLALSAGWSWRLSWQLCLPMSIRSIDMATLRD